MGIWLVIRMYSKPSSRCLNLTYVHYERIGLIGSGMVLTAAEEYPERTRGSISLMERRNEIVEGLLA